MDALPTGRNQLLRRKCIINECDPTTRTLQSLIISNIKLHANIDACIHRIKSGYTTIKIMLYGQTEQCHGNLRNIRTLLFDQALRTVGIVKDVECATTAEAEQGDNATQNQGNDHDDHQDNRNCIETAFGGVHHFEGGSTIFVVAFVFAVMVLRLAVVQKTYTEKAREDKKGNQPFRYGDRKNVGISIHKITLIMAA